MDIISFLFQLGSTNWLFTAFIGAVLGLLLPVVGKAIVFGFRLLSRNQIEGTWYNHFFSYDDKGTLFAIEKIEIRKGFSSKFSIASQLVDNPTATYLGKVKFEKNFIVLELRARDHDENVYCRFPTPPILTSDTALVGASLAQDFSGYATAAVNILARQRLQEDRVLTLIKERSSVDLRNRTLRVARKQ